MKVLYLFTSYRGAMLEKARHGEDHGNGFWGMLRLPHFGIKAEHLEPEQFYPKSVSEFIRKHFGVYWQHLSVYLKFFSYDFVFTSTAFGTQLVHTLLHVSKPKWVMHDFSIMGLIGDGKTFKQKIFAYMVERCAGVVTLSDEEKEALEARFPNLRGRVERIAYGIDLNFFAPSEVPQERLIFSPGRDSDRDYKTLFEAAAPLDTPVVVTTLPSRLKKFNPLPAFVSIRDFSLSEYVDAYRRAQIVVLPLDTSSGLNNAMGYSVLQESLAMGKAIVATSTGTTRTFIADKENGLLVPEGDVEAMRAAIQTLLDDTRLRERLGQAARAYAEKNLGAEMLTGKLADFLKRLASV